MNRADNIIMDYQRADEEQRLNLFLTHRELRSEFMAIEQQLQDQVAMPADRKTTGSIRRCHQWCLAKILPFPA